MTIVLEPSEIEVPVSVPVSTPKPATPTTISNTLDLTADILAKGWCTGIRTDERGYHCALGGIEALFNIPHIEHVPGLPSNTVDFIGKYLVGTGREPDLFLDDSAYTLCRWNNKSDQATVIATFREAAEAARKLGV